MKITMTIEEKKLHWVKSGAITLKNFLDNTRNQGRTRKDISLDSQVKKVPFHTAD